MTGFLKLMSPSQPFRFNDITKPSKSGFETTLLELLCSMIHNWSKVVKLCGQLFFCYQLQINFASTQAIIFPCGALIE